MEDVLTKIDRLKVSMTMQEQQMQVESEAMLRDTSLYAQDLDQANRSGNRFYDELQRAQDNGMSREDASQIMDTYNQASEDLSVANAKNVQYTMEDNLRRTNEIAEQYPMEQRVDVYDNKALQYESLYRAGLQQEAQQEPTPDIDQQFTAELDKAKENGLSEERAEQLQDMYNKAGEDLTPHSAKEIKSLMTSDIKEINEKLDSHTGFGKIAKSAEKEFTELPKKFEEMVRNGQSKDAPGILKNYQDSMNKTAGLTQARDEQVAARVAERSKFVNREQAEQQIGKSLQSLVNSSQKTGKNAEINAAGQNIQTVVKIGQDGKKTTEVIVNGVKSTVSKAAGTVASAIPGAREAKIAVKILKGIVDKMQQKQKQMEQSMGEAMR